jgi:hypothetical protein
MRSISDFDLCTQLVKFMLALLCALRFPWHGITLCPPLATAPRFEERYQLDSSPQEERNCSLSTHHTSTVIEIEVE